MIRGYDEVEGIWEVPMDDIKCWKNWEGLFECTKVSSMAVESDMNDSDYVLSEHIELVVNDIVVWKWNGRI